MARRRRSQRRAEAAAPTPGRRREETQPPAPGRLRKVAGFVAAAVLAAVGAQVTGLTEKMVDKAVAWVHPTEPLIVTGERIEPPPLESPASSPGGSDTGEVGEVGQEGGDGEGGRAGQGGAAADGSAAGGAAADGSAGGGSAGKEGHAGKVGSAGKARAGGAGRITQSIYECGRAGDGLVVARPAAQIKPPRGTLDDADENVPAWIKRYDAADRNQTHYQVEVQGRAGRTVVLRRMYVDYLDRADPPATATVVQLRYEECGDPAEPRYFTADLDNPSGRWRAVRGTPDFPYKISNDDPEIFRLTARTAACDCRWRIALEWASDGSTGTTYLEETFHTVADRGYPRVAWSAYDGPWEPAR